MANFLDLTGQTFGRLTVLSRTDSTDKRTRWLCICTCGTSHIARTQGLRNGFTSSCGCAEKERLAAPRSHGMSGTLTHRSWCAMKTRCTNPNVPSYADYGGRGIKICEHWINSFENFFADMGERPGLNYSIDRINVNGNYEPSNCRWATTSEQMNNTTRSVYLEHRGLTLSLSEWSRRIGIDVAVLSWRVQQGWSPTDALTRKPRIGLRRTPQPHRKDGTFQRTKGLPADNGTVLLGKD